jgi:hypothetical protein
MVHDVKHSLPTVRRRPKWRCSAGSVTESPQVAGCDVDAHRCVPGFVLDCDDENGCTADTCDAAIGCVHALIDGDGDGFATGTCPLGTPGDDCDDTDGSVYPGAPEQCDAISHDCDAAVDEDVTTIACQRDRDMDGFGDAAVTMDACACPAGYIPPRGDGESDCYDGDGRMFPGQVDWFDVGACDPFCLPGFAPPPRPFDFDCDGAETPRYGVLFNSGLCSLTCAAAGWAASVPGCGQDGTWRSCDDASGSCMTLDDTRTQSCR